MPSFSRRTFLAATALLAPVRLRARDGQPRPSTPAVSLDEFVRLSERLVGRTGLDAELAATYFKALSADAANVSDLSHLVRGGGRDLTPAHHALERTIIEWWYTGAYTVGGEPRLAAHAGALTWAALGVPAPGTCAGRFGDWSRAPKPIA